MDSLTTEILAASNRWMQAWIDKDGTTLEALLAPDFALVYGDAATHRFERAAWLELALGDYHCHSITYHNVKVRRITADVVVMSSIAEIDADIIGEERTGKLFIVDLWRRNAVGWQVCARFTSRAGAMEASVKALIDH